MDITFTPYAIGLMASVLTEVLKYLPILNSKPIYKSLTAVLVVAAGAFYMSGFSLAAWDWERFFMILIFAFVNYKVIVKPVAESMNLRTQ